MNLFSKSANINGFKFLDNDKTKLTDFIYEVRTIIEKYFKNEVKLKKLSNNDFNKIVYKAQQEINKKHNPTKLFERYNQLFQKELLSKKIYTQHYFYLRAVRPQNFKQNKNSIGMHRETFQGPKWFKNICNLWIPIKNCKKNNAIRHYEKSHKLIENKDFFLEEFKVPVKKKSYSHKIGNLYLERKIKFKEKRKEKRLYKKNNSIIFSGELMHGNGKNYTKNIRYSLDARFILKKHFKKNIIQSANNKPYFALVKI